MRTLTELLIIVPARGGSRRIPGKNLRQLGGKSLLAHTADAVRASGLQAPVLLTTDHEGIAEEGRRLGWQVPFRRPAELAGDSAPTVDAVLHALDWWRTEWGEDPAAVMVLQPTSPFRGGDCLAAGIARLRARQEVDCVIAMTESHLPPARLYLVGEDGIGEALSPDLRRPVYWPNGALYLTRTAAIRKERKLYTHAILPLVLEAWRALDIDTEADWRVAEALLAAGLPEDSGCFSPRLAREGAVG